MEAFRQARLYERNTERRTLGDLTDIHQQPD
jgi:hypothetical protein